VVDVSVGQQDRVDIGGAERKRAVVEFLERLWSLEEATVNEDARARHLEEMTRTGDSSRGAAKAQCQAHCLISQGIDCAGTPSSRTASVECGTALVDLTKRIFSPGRVLSTGIPVRARVLQAKRQAEFPRKRARRS